MSRDIFVEVEQCRACGSNDLSTVLSFGFSPLANGYLTKDQLSKPEPEAPLEVVLCEDCACVQLRHTVDPSRLFKDYLYHSGESGTLREHFKQYAKDVIKELRLEPRTDFVIGIGGNDGTLELEFERHGFEVWNIEPSSTGAANPRFWMKRWFDEETAKLVLDRQGPVSLITCNNCFAHMPDVCSVVRGVEKLLKKGGHFIIECADLDATLAHGLFDQFYHEHVFYWNEASLRRLFYGTWLRVVDVQRNANQGGSLRMTLRKETPKPELVGCAQPTLKERFQKLKHFIDSRIKDVRVMLDSLSKDDRTLSCYGWPAKATLLARLLGLSSENVLYAVDEMPSKQGLFTPGSHIPIVSRRHFIDEPTDCCLIMAGNYEKRIRFINREFQGKWLVATLGYQTEIV